MRGPPHFDKLQPYETPVLRKTAFNCPNCNAYAKQHWGQVYYYEAGPNPTNTPDHWIARCEHCRKFSIWFKEKMIDPLSVTAPLPNEGMPDNVKGDFEEARAISTLSTRGACALLRLSIEKLCENLGEENGDLNEKIGNLVSKGLPQTIQKSLDIVRVTGNEAIHPGVLDLKDDQGTVNSLFGLVNLITQTMITSPKEIGEIYDRLPKEKLDSIEKRDEKN